MGTSASGSSLGGVADVGLFALADRRLTWLGAREAVLAQNVANADTPGFQQRDLKSFAQVLSGQAMEGPVLARTDGGHLQGLLDGRAGTQSPRGEKAPDGNAVSLDDQLQKIAQTESDHEFVTAMYRKYLSMFRTALGR